MAIIHLNPENARQASLALRRSQQEADGALETLRTSMNKLDSTWEGGGADEFLSDYQQLSFRFSMEIEALQLLLQRVEREIQEWETVDLTGSLAFRNNGQNELGWLIQNGLFPSTSGGWAVPEYLSPIWVITTALSIAEIIANLPPWLREMLLKFFPVEPPIISPLPDNPPAPIEAQPPTPPETLPDLKTPPEPKPEIAPPPEVITPETVTPDPKPDGEWEVSYDVPTKSQGNLYGNAACSPTSVSMVLDYFHAKDPALKTIAPQDLIGMMDSGDGTPGRGMALTNLTDELGDLGYHNVTVQSGASMTDLETALKNGPVIVTAGVKITGPGSVNANVPRAIDGAGNTMHAMVVKAISDDQVAVNDPWTGTEIKLPLKTFQDMWTRGQGGLYAIQP